MHPESPHLTASANLCNMSWSCSSSCAFSKTMSPALTWGRCEDLGSWGPLILAGSSSSISVGTEGLVLEWRHSLIGLIQIGSVLWILDISHIFFPLIAR
jgi:hypothetical protein